MLKKENMINDGLMFEDIRKLLNLTIEQFVFEMNWPNAKYYNYIKNGRKRPGGTVAIKSSPTLQKTFNGINSAIANYDNWAKNKDAIALIINKHLMPSINNENDL